MRVFDGLLVDCARAGHKMRTIRIDFVTKS